MKEIKARFSPFSAIVFMLVIMTVIISIQSIFIYLSVANDNKVLDQLNQTTTETNKLSASNNELINETKYISQTNTELIKSNNDILESSNRTETAIAKLRELQERFGNVPIENKEILENITDDIDSILGRLSK